MFRRLAIFTGPFDLAAAEWVVGGGEAIEVTNAVGRLAEQSLVTVESGPFGRRFRLLEPIREFGREQLDEAGTTELLAERHARWCWCEVTGVHRLLAGWDEHEGVARLAELWPNLRSAFDWACGTGRLELARALLAPILSEIVVRSANELGDWGERLLAAAPDQDGESRVLGLYAAAHRYSMTQDPHAYDALAAHYDGPDHVLAAARACDRVGGLRPDGAVGAARGGRATRTGGRPPRRAGRDQRGGGLAEPRRARPRRRPARGPHRPVPAAGPADLPQLDAPPARLLGPVPGGQGDRRPVLRRGGRDRAAAPDAHAC